LSKKLTSSFVAVSISNSCRVITSLLRASLLALRDGELVREVLLEFDCPVEAEEEDLNRCFIIVAIEDEGAVGELDTGLGINIF
jgi:hypothetical protein